MRTSQVETIKYSNMLTARKNFWALNDSVVWNSYPTLELDSKIEFYRSPFRTDRTNRVPLFNNIDWYPIEQNIMPDEPEYKIGETVETRTVIATRDCRVVSLLAIQIMGYHRFKYATLEQLNSMLSHVYRYAVRSQDSNPMYSIGYVWQSQFPFITVDSLTVGGHFKRDKCQCPIPVIVSTNKDTFDSAIAFYPIHEIVEYQWGTRNPKDMTLLAMVAMASNGTAKAWKWFK